MARALRVDKTARAAEPFSTEQRLWAPWRYAYLRSGPSAKRACIFCFGSPGPAERRKRLVLHVAERSVVMLNRYPYNNGHLMIAPRRHVASPELLTPEEQLELSQVLAQSVRLLRGALSPSGFNLGSNIGASAGAGFAEHMHWHVVPRWDGDNNFMPVLASTRVLSQHLLDSYARLNPVFMTLKAGLS